MAISFPVYHPLPKETCVKLEYHALACQFALESVFSRGIPGDIAEFGVNEGDNMIPMCQLIRKRGPRRSVFAFDTFAGLPWGEDNPEGPNLEKGECCTPFDRFWEIMGKHGMQDMQDMITPVKGLVEETTVAEEWDELSFAFTFLDLDLEDSLRVALDYVTPRTYAGGIFGMHDVGHPKIPGPMRIMKELEAGELHPGKWQRWGPIVGNACFFEKLED